MLLVNSAGTGRLPPPETLELIPAGSRGSCTGTIRAGTSLEKLRQELQEQSRGGGCCAGWVQNRRGLSQVPLPTQGNLPTWHKAGGLWSESLEMEPRVKT